MAPRAATAVRVDYAVRELLKGRSGPALTAELAETHGISRRQARRVVALGYKQIQADIEETDISRPQLVAQLVHCLQTAMAQALASQHPSAVVGTARELRELLGLGAEQQQQHRPMVKRWS
jgi:hypothetical protein